MKFALAALLLATAATPAIAHAKAKIVLTEKKQKKSTIKESNLAEYSLQNVAAAQLDTSDEFNYSGFQVCFEGDAKDVEAMVYELAKHEPKADVLEVKTKQNSVAFRFKFQSNGYLHLLDLGRCN